MKWLIGKALLLLIFACACHLWHQQQETTTIIKSSNQLETDQQTVFESKVKLSVNVVSVKSEACNPPDTRSYDAYMNWWNEQMEVWNGEERCPRIQHTHEVETEHKDNANVDKLSNAMHIQH